ncbi:uncharacterized protein LTR77_001991 [Saxophila tyrrhenica]|uniref:ASST-domain-containing protein n=1 Tax=Saxophila tyrrhenica TaxID=1690608 RepID=A0AAV9PKT7_9PEZI|nr:hypothetical protein LTR77_001991 [Saxophila tyrrhenica]
MRYTCSVAFLLSYLTCMIVAAEKTPKYEYHGMRKFLTRPDIEVPTWKVSVYDEAKVAPGHWFVAPYEVNGNKKPGGSWIGPHIFDSTGELVWSGSHMFKRINVMDFGVMDVGGEDLLSLSYAVEGRGYILDKQYKVKQTVVEGMTGKTYNMHDFHTVENGSHFLYLQRNITHASAQLAKQDLGYDGECSVTFPGFEERDVKTGEVLFKWDATGKIPLSDSTLTHGPVENRCTGGAWDYLHSNAIDKLPDGHYLLSTRHSDTIYKISADDGSILWRLHGLGGDRSDFAMGDLKFSRQHDVRFREHNVTHLIISFLDNATGADPQPATHEWSRGLLIAVSERDMTAAVIASYDHPQHGKSYRRGSYQPLPNGNVFMGWSEQALHSEHTPDGKIVMEAVLTEHKLGTYRSFKFPFTADPQYPPDIYANASTFASITQTSVYASWNGATEVASWRLSKTDKKGEKSLPLTIMPRSGFETLITYDGYAKYVVVEALDINGRSLHTSDVAKTVASKNLDPDAVAEEQQWLHPESSSASAGSSLRGFGVFTGGLFCGVALLWGALFWKRRRERRRPRYERVAGEEEDETKMDELSHR